MSANLEFSNTVRLRFSLNLEQAKRMDYQLFNLGNDITGAASIDQKRVEEQQFYPYTFVAFNELGTAIFTCGASYCSGEIILGDNLFYTHENFRGKGIAKKMAVVALKVIQKLIIDKNLPLKNIGLTSIVRDGAMAQIAKYIGMKHTDIIEYQMSEFPDVETLMHQLQIKSI